MYLLATFIYGYTMQLYASYREYRTGEMIVFLAYVTITLIGLPMVYRINSQLDNKDFLKRYLAVTWVVRMKLIIVYVPVSLVYQAANGFRSSVNLDRTFTIGISILMSILYYYLSVRAFKRLTRLAQAGK